MAVFARSAVLRAKCDISELNFGAHVTGSKVDYQHMFQGQYQGLNINVVRSSLAVASLNLGFALVNNSVEKAGFVVCACSTVY